MGTEIQRKLASIQRIEEVRDIKNADAIQAYRVLGWWVVDKKDAHKVGDLVVYLSIDSWVPNELAPFLSKNIDSREYNGVKGERLRTIRLRGQVSQGLLLNPHGIQELDDIDLDEGIDLTEILGIQKWEAPIPAQLAGRAKGTFPSWGRKTDQERCQNLWRQIEQYIADGVKFEVTVKLDGSSASYGLSPDKEYVVCSRNMSLETNQENNTFVNISKKYDLEAKLKEYDRPLLISGELCGPGIQKNQEGLKEHQLFVFDVYDPMTASYLSARERSEIIKDLALQYVPILHENVTLTDLGIKTLDDLLEFAEGPSLNAAQREGVVFKSVDGLFSFKAISTSWLLSTGN
jgi:RNA ligase (TIGR02306 family)